MKKHIYRYFDSKYSDRLSFGYYFSCQRECKEIFTLTTKQFKRYLKSWCKVNIKGINFNYKWDKSVAYHKELGILGHDINYSSSLRVKLSFKRS